MSNVLSTATSCLDLSEDSVALIRRAPCRERALHFYLPLLGTAFPRLPPEVWPGFWGGQLPPGPRCDDDGLLDPHLLPFPFDLLMCLFVTNGE